MGKRTRYLGVSKSGSGSDATWSCAKLAKEADARTLFILRDGKDPAIEAALYLVDEDRLQDEVSLFNLEEPAQSMAMHPAGDGLLCVSSSSCRLIEAGSAELGSSQELPAVLQNMGAQNCVAFSGDGSRLAFGGQDGWLRVFEWPSLKVVLDEPRAHKAVKHLDFSLDGALLASTSDDGPCRVWDLEKGTSLTSLHKDKDEKFGFCRFSRNGSLPFLFITLYKDGKGHIGVWDIVNWARLGSKQFQDSCISAFAMSSDGKRLAVATVRGDIAVIEVRKMVVWHEVKGAHVAQVTSLEFSPDSRALLSVSADGNVRVTATQIAAGWKDWQVYLLLLALVLMSALLFYVFFQYSDSFWNFPLGTNQAAPKLRMGAIFGGEDDSDPSSGW